MIRSRNLLPLLALLAVSISFAAFAQESTELTPCDTALISINLDEMTVGFAGTGQPFPEEWLTSAGRGVVEANGDLISTARDAGLLIIYLYGSYTYLAPGQVMMTFADEIAPQEGDILIGRPGPNLNVFTDTILLETLESRGIRNLIFSGLNTAYCISKSSRFGLSLGFDVTVVADTHSGGAPGIAKSYNEWWPSLGISIVPMAEIDFTALCAECGE
ncbi:isochorismatase family protein [Candidatus Bipolaricaulota bacterium]